MDFKYDVALSFAGENRPYVDDVARALKEAGVKVFYDAFEPADLWGEDLYTHLREVYERQARYTIIFASEYYAAKIWTSHERESAQARAIKQREEYILPARFDDTEIPGIPHTRGYIDLRKTSPQRLAEIFLDKLGRRPSSPPPSLGKQQRLGDVLQQKRAIRSLVLETLYQRLNGKAGMPIDRQGLGRELGLDDEAVEAAIDYLVGEGLAKIPTFEGVTITHLGVKEIESLHSDPDR